MLMNDRQRAEAERVSSVGESLKRKSLASLDWMFPPRSPWDHSHVGVGPYLQRSHLAECDQGSTERAIAALAMYLPLLNVTVACPGGMSGKLCNLPTDSSLGILFGSRFELRNMPVDQFHSGPIVRGRWGVRAADSEVLRGGYLSPEGVPPPRVLRESGRRSKGAGCFGRLSPDPPSGRVRHRPGTHFQPRIPRC